MSSAGDELVVGAEGVMAGHEAVQKLVATVDSQQEREVDCRGQSHLRRTVIASVSIPILTYPSILSKHQRK